MSGVTRAIDKNPCESYGFGSTSGTSSWMPKEVWQCVWARMIMGQLELIGVEIRLDCLWRSFGLSSPDTACWFDAVQDMQISILQLLLWRRTWLQWCRETRIIFALTGKVIWYILKGTCQRIPVLIKGSLVGETSVLRKELVKETVSQGKS